MSRDLCSGSSLVIGRFQPLHRGHMGVLLKCAEESEHLIVGIGSAQYSHHPENPFTAGERYLMINRALRAEGVSDYSIVPVEDLNRYSVWVSHVVSMVPPFGAVYSNNPMTRRLFQEAGYEVRDSPIYDRSLYSGTEIRRRMVAGEDWRHLVPDPVARVIDDIDGESRLKAICGGMGDAPLRCRSPCRGTPVSRCDHVLCRIMHRRPHSGIDDGHPGVVPLLHRRRCDLQQRFQGIAPRSVP